MAAPFNARLLVTAQHASDAGALAAKLERLGLATVAASGDVASCTAAAANDVDAALIDASDRPIDAAARLADALRLAARPRLLTILVIAAPSADIRPYSDSFDAVLRAPAHPAQIAARAQLVLRLTVMEDEARLRAQTLAARGVDVDLGLSEEAFRAPQVLYVGAPTPYFLGLERGVAAAEGRLVACFTAFTAFDYLHERDFDAVVLNAIETTEPAYTICGGLRRNTRLFHTPILFLVDLATFDDVDEAFARGVSDLLPVSAPPGELARRTLSLARERRRRDAVKAAFVRARTREPENDVIDSTTGIATPTFFAAHLDAMARRAKNVSRPLSLILLRVIAPRAVSEASREDALRQIGGMIRHLVRAEDLAARVAPNVYAIAMPGARRDAAEGAATRLEAVAECTAFEGGDLDDPFQVKMQSAVSELDPAEGGGRLFARLIETFGDHAKAG